MPAAVALPAADYLAVSPNPATCVFRELIWQCSAPLLAATSLASLLSVPAIPGKAIDHDPARGSHKYRLREGRTGPTKSTHLHGHHGTAPVRPHYRARPHTRVEAVQYVERCWAQHGLQVTMNQRDRKA